MYKTVLVAVDLSHGPVSEHIIRVGRFLADTDGEVFLLHVINPLPSYVAAQLPAEIAVENLRRAETDLAALADRVDGVETGLVVEGAPATMILAEADRIAADVIVLGSHRPDLSDYFLGSTAARVVRHAQCSVVVERSMSLT